MSQYFWTQNNDHYTICSLEMEVKSTFTWSIWACVVGFLLASSFFAYHFGLRMGELKCLSALHGLHQVEPKSNDLQAQYQQLEEKYVQLEAIYEELYLNFRHAHAIIDRAASESTAYHRHCCPHQAEADTLENSMSRTTLRKDLQEFLQEHGRQPYSEWVVNG